MPTNTVDDRFNYDDLRRFIGTVAERQDIMEFRALGAHGAEAMYRTADQTADPDDEFWQWLEHHNTVGAVYVGPNPQRSMRGGGHRGVGTDDDVVLARCLFADFDDTTREAAEAAIKSCGMPTPSLLIATRGEHGNGWHAYWRLAEPLSDMTVWRACQGRLIELLGSDPTIKNPSRIMRAPGSFNRKRDGVCRIVAYHDERYALDTLPVALGAAATGVQPIKPSTPPGTGTPLRGDAPEPLDGPATPVQKVLAGLSRVGRSGNGWSACCPAHDDRNPSLSISEGDDGRALLHCFAGCAVAKIVEALGLEMADLSPAATDKTPHREPKVRILSAPGPLMPRCYATADEAIAVLDAQLGDHTKTWTYHDADQRPVGLIVRWDTPEGKQIRPVSHNAEGWFIGAMPGPCPLYHLPSLKNAARVYVCEGEKAAEAASAAGLVATTSAGGSQAARKTDWSPLAGKEVVILPDHDEAGEDYAEDVVQALLKLEPAPTVKVIRLPDLPEHGDIVDFLELRGGDADAVRSRVAALVEQAAREVEEAPQANRLEYQPFPVKALPRRPAGYVVRVAKAMGCDPSYIALPLLSALAAAVGNSRAIRLKPGWIEPPIIWAAIVGESGTLKTPAQDKALRPVRDRQREAMHEFDQAHARHKCDMLIHDRLLKEWKIGVDEPSPPPVEPAAPIAQRYIVEDTTIEALALLLQDQPRGLLLVRDELSGWLSSFDRYAQGKGGDAAKWLEMFGAKPLLVDRKTGPARMIYVPRAAVSLIGGIQPETLRRALGDEYFENGLAARLLFAMPPRKSKRWTDAAVDPVDEQDLKRLFDRLYALRMDTDENGDFTPRVLDLTPEARQVWIGFYNEHAAEQHRLGGALASAWSKLEGYAARFALIVHLVQCQEYGLNRTDPMKVDAESVRKGIMLARWFGHEARRVYARLRETEGDRERRDLADIIRGLDGSVTVRNWQNLRGLKSSKEAEAQLKALEAAGLGVFDMQPQRGPGRPSKVFRLNTETIDTIDIDKTPAPSESHGVLSKSILSSDGPDVDGAAKYGESDSVDPADAVSDKTPIRSESLGVLSKTIMSSSEADTERGVDTAAANLPGAGDTELDNTTIVSTPAGFLSKTVLSQGSVTSHGVREATDQLSPADSSALDKTPIQNEPQGVLSKTLMSSNESDAGRGAGSDPGDCAEPGDPAPDWIADDRQGANQPDPSDNPERN